MTATAAMTAMTLSFSARVVVLVAHCRCSWTSAGMFYFHLPSGSILDLPIMVCSTRRLGAHLLLGVGLVSMILGSIGRTFVPPPVKPTFAGTAGASAAVLTSLLTVPSAEAQEFGAGIIAPRGDLFANSEAVLEMRENPPFFAQWPPLVQIAVPVVALVAVAAAAPLLFGEMIDKATIRRAKR